MDATVNLDVRNDMNNQAQQLQSKVNQVFGGGKASRTPQDASGEQTLETTPPPDEAKARRVFLTQHTSSTDSQTSDPEYSIALPPPPHPSHLTPDASMPQMDFCSDICSPPVLFENTLVSPVPAYVPNHPNPPASLDCHTTMVPPPAISIPMIMTEPNPKAAPNHPIFHSISLAHVLHDAAPKPIDLDSFRTFCRKNQADDHLDFWLVIEYTFRHVKNQESYIHVIDYILETYLLTPPRILSNIPIHLVKSALSNASKARKIAKRTGEINAAVFDDVQMHVFDYLNNHVYPKFKRECVINDKLERTREEALWWKRPIILTEFFSYPNPGLLIIAFGGYPFCFFLLYGYIARLLAGHRLDIISYITLFLILPAKVVRSRFLPTEFIAGPPKRFAQGVGAALMLIYCPHYLVSPQTHIATWVILIVLMIQTLLAALVNKCIFSMIFGFALNRKWLPKSVRKACEEGDDYVENELYGKH